MVCFTSEKAVARSPQSPNKERRPWLRFMKKEIFGEGCLTGQSRRLATAIAMTDCELLRLDDATIKRVIHEQPDFAELFIAHLLARNMRVEADLVDQLFNSSEKRLARLLLLMANFGKDGKAEPISISSLARRMLLLLFKFWHRVGPIATNLSVRARSSEPSLGRCGSGPPRWPPGAVPRHAAHSSLIENIWAERSQEMTYGAGVGLA
jgi:hypothetical protein